jgi:hypothetical protein
VSEDYADLFCELFDRLDLAEFHAAGEAWMADGEVAATAAEVERAALDGEPVAVCSQGKVLPDALAMLLGESSAERFATPKGDGWLIAFGGGERALAADRFGVGGPTSDD